MTSRPLDTLLLQAPFWLIGAGLLIAMVGAAWLGRSMRLRHERLGAKSKSSDDKGEAREGYIVSAVLGLLALLTGFTFALALERFDTRRERVLLEANAIESVYLQTQVLEEPHRTRISNLLREYTDTSLRLALADKTEPELRRRGDQLIVSLWNATVNVFPLIKQYDFSSTYMEQMNDLIDLDSARRIAREAHVPGEVYLLLILYQIGTALVIGYVLIGDQGRSSAILLFILFSMSIMLIIDIDRPTSGWIETSQKPMLELQKFLRTNPPSTFGALQH